MTLSVERSNEAMNLIASGDRLLPTFRHSEPTAMDSDEYIRPPGTYYDIVAHPTDAKRSIEIAVVQDHRFAFFYWLKWKKAIHGQRKRPSLVSLDWHQDLAQPCEIECAWLKELDTNDYRAISLFCWDKLPCQNDGHILAAAYLNIIGDVHVVQKQDEPSVDQFEDIEGRPHAVHCYDSVQALIKGVEMQEIPSVFFDIDLDYFTESQDSCGGGEDVKLVSIEDIQRHLRPDGELMSWLFPRMCGMTIATEPEFCGGLVNSNRLFAMVNDALFDPQLLSHRAAWKHHA